MDKQILFVRSEIDSTKALKNRNLVSFHKQQHLSFNQTTLENVDIHPGMYASFHSIDRGKRTIVIEIRTEKISWQKSAWYKITNPKVSKHNRYCYIRTTNLLYDFGIILLGAFEYKVYYDFGRHYIKIYY